MCTPDIKTITPVTTKTVSNEDPVASQLEQEKKRRGFQTTIATSAGGLSTAAPTAKTQLGT
ncbi:MAG: hypothetical protein H6Q72_4129 [Firmicutes bacterium]|nr:hypothetical protein [Bacillota bacterium]